MIKNLRFLRTRMGISQQALGSALGIRHQSVNKYENQKIEPDIATLIAMADFFGTTVDFLIGRESEENKREENDILSRYKALSPKKRACADLAIRTLYEEKQIALTALRESKRPVADRNGAFFILAFCIPAGSCPFPF